MSFLRHRSFGLAPNYRASLTGARDYLRADPSKAEMGVTWLPGQTLVSLRARLPEEEAPGLPPLNLRPDMEAIAADDQFVALRTAEQAQEDPADLLLRLVSALRRERSDKRAARRASSLFVAWRLRKLDRNNTIDAKADAKAISDILNRLMSLTD